MVTSLAVCRDPAVWISVTLLIDIPTALPLTWWYFWWIYTDRGIFHAWFEVKLLNEYHGSGPDSQPSVLSQANFVLTHTGTHRQTHTQTQFLYTHARTDRQTHITNTRSVTPLAASMSLCFQSMRTSHLGLLLSSFVFSAGRSQTPKW